jgi:penicillin-binding protein 1C
MGNLDRAPMKDVTGSTGPALAMRSIFQVLNKNRDANDLYLSPSLIEADICTRPAATDGTCPKRTEYFSHNLAPENISAEKDISRELIRPTHGLRMAYDPRIPAGHQKFRFELAGLNSGEEVEWILNGNTLGRTNEPRYLWPVAKGPQKLAVVIHKDGAPVQRLQPISFSVR